MNTEFTNKKAEKQAAVSGRYITLKRDDLIEYKKDILIQDVNIFDFKSTSISIDEIMKADYILFSDDDNHKILKDRFGNGR